MKRKKLLAFLMVFVLTAGLFVGCSGGSDKEPKEKAKTESKDASREDEIVLTYWGWESNVYEPMMAAYTERHPNVTFEVSDVASADYVTKLQQTIASGSELPDIIVSEMSYRGQMLAMDIWENLEDEAYGVTEDMFFDYTVDLMSNDNGDIVCIDESVSPAAFAYKRDVAKEYLGTDDPKELESMFTSVDDLIRIAKEVQEKSDGEVYLFATAGAVERWVSNIVLDSAVNEEGELDFTTKRGSAIKSLCDLRDAGAIDVIQQWTPQDNAAYADSKHILFPAANWSPEYSIKPNDPDGAGNWGMFVPPGGGFSWGGTAIGINKESEYKDVVWDFIKFCTIDKEGVDIMRAEAGYYTPVQSLYGDPEFVSDKDEYFAGQDIGDLYYNQIVPNMKAAPLTEYDGIIDEVMTFLIQNIMADKNYTYEQALADGIAEVSNRLPDMTVK